jgi:hypothetical protein
MKIRIIPKDTLKDACLLDHSSCDPPAGIPSDGPGIMFDPVKVLIKR